MNKEENMTEFPLLRQINSSADLKRLSESELISLSDETRQFLIQVISDCGGHFAAGLGVIELTIALHYLLDTPRDRLVWDVGHQSYPHKLLTGRREQLSSIRQKGGLAPFPSRTESEYDCFGVGHSSTSISAALGMAIAAARHGDQRRTVAVIGDGGMTAGMAFEALNHTGDTQLPLLVILNDNEMSISPNVGALSSRFAQVLSSPWYATLRQGGKKALEHLPGMRELARRTEEHVKGLIIPGTLFEELGFNYIGPIDGHDLPSLLSILRQQLKLSGPQFLHIVTRKGKGYAPAEENPVKYHGVSRFDPEVGIVPSKQQSKITYSQLFGDWACDIAERDQRLFLITPAMLEGSGLVKFAQRFPDRCIDVGIAEQHSLTLAAGMACDGLKPVVAIYSTFLQRAYDQLVHDIVLQNLPVMLAVDRAGLVGADGATHNGSYDISFMRCLPNIILMAPADENECRRLLSTAYSIDGPTAIRYPRGSGPGVTIEKDSDPLPVGKAEIRRQGKNIALLAFGSMVPVAQEVGDKLDATVVNMRFIKPLDTELLLELAQAHEQLICIEENVISGGAGSAVNEWLAANDLAPARLYGLPDRFIEHGSREDMLNDAGMTADDFHAFINKRT